jgi:coiled-coil and C2 domain-containing protein 2A
MKLYARIYLNNKLVNTTNKSQLSNDFTASWGQIFNIYMISHPRSILVNIYEQVDSSDRLIGEVNLPPPELNCTSASYSLESYDFSSKTAFYMHLKTSNQLELFYTSGVLRAGSGWGVDERTGVVLVPPSLVAKRGHMGLNQEERKSYDAIAALGMSRMQNMDKLAEWIAKSNLDPNDPRNADLINLIQTLTGLSQHGVDAGLSGLKLPEHFRLDQLIEEFNFAQEAEIEANKRFRLIELRWSDEPEFRGLKMIPALDKLVKEEQFEAFKKRKEGRLEEEKEFGESMGKSLRGGELQNEIEIARINGQRIIAKIRERIIKQFKFTENQKVLADMVIEEQVPNIKYVHFFLPFFCYSITEFVPERRSEV